MFYVLMLALSLLFTPAQANTATTDYPSLVRVVIMGPDEQTKKVEEQGHGSGVIVGPHTIFTAKHVGKLKKGYSLKVYDGNGKAYTVSKIVLDPKNDFATLTIKETLPGTPARIDCTPVQTLDHLFVVGYPLDFPALVFEVIATDYIPTQNGTILAATGVALAGDSGGPVFNRAGEVVGILVGEFETQSSPFGGITETDLNTIVPMTETACKAVA